MTSETKEFYKWIVERHEIYRRRVLGNPYPWSTDKILNEYKFTNPFRENDAVTIWMREHFLPHHIEYEEATLQNNIVNAALFRMVGTTEFAEDFLESHGWITRKTYLPDLIKEIIEERIANKQRCFTGAYIVTNQGIKAPKSQVVIDNFITPLWKSIYSIYKHQTFNSQEELHTVLSSFRGFGGGGFMAYEVVCDALHTLVYARNHAGYINIADSVTDRYSWANAGPGALRGLNRIWGDPLNQRMSARDALLKMRTLIGLKHLAHDIAKEKDYKPIVYKDIDLRCIEHSLCEYDKYMRVKEKQGRPRSVCKYKEGEVYPVKKGPVE